MHLLHSAFSHFLIRCGVLLLALLLTGCATAPAAVPSSVPEQTPVPEAAPAPTPIFDPAVAAAAAEKAFHAALHVDLSLNTLPEMATIQDIAANFSFFFAMEETLESAVRRACTEAYLEASTLYTAALPAFDISLSLPRWQELVSLYRVLGSDFEKALHENLLFSAETDETRITCSVYLAHYDEMFGKYSGEAFPTN